MTSHSFTFIKWIPGNECFSRSILWDSLKINRQIKLRAREIYVKNWISLKVKSTTNLVKFNDNLSLIFEILFYLRRTVTTNPWFTNFRRVLSSHSSSSFRKLSCVVLVIRCNIISITKHYNLERKDIFSLTKSIWTKTYKIENYKDWF